MEFLVIFIQSNSAHAEKILFDRAGSGVYDEMRQNERRKDVYKKRIKVMRTKEKFMQKTIVVWLGALVCCLLWGSAFPCIKIGYQMMHIASDEVASQILYAGYRFTMAGILTILFGSIGSRQFLHPTRNSIGKVLKLSSLQTVAQYLLFYIGLAHTSGVKASIIEALNVFVAILIASFLFHQEKLTVRKVAGCIVGFAGVALVNMGSSGFDFHMSFTGEGFIFLSTVAYAFSSVLVKGYSKTENPVMLSGYQFLAGGIIMALCGFAAGGSVSGFTAASFGLLFYMACISAVAYTLWGILLKYNPISRVAVFGFMNPVFGVILSAWLLGEKEQAAGVKSVIALVLVCIGIFVVNLQDKTENEKVES